MKKITFFGICLLMVSNLFATDYYVKAGGNNAGGLDEANAFSTISGAVSAASSGDKIFIVGPISHTVTVNIAKSLTFQGTNTAVLTGGTGRMFQVTTPSLTISFNDITFKDVDTVNAGAVFIQNQDSNLSFTNCVFENNKSGASAGALIISNGNLTITDCSFINNSAIGNGGAIQTTGGDLTISGSKFSGNSATNGSGGALYVGGGAVASTFTLTTSTFNGNSCANAGLTSSGGGVIVINNLRQALVSFCTFYDNISDINGGGLHFNSTNATSKVTNVTCFENKLRQPTAIAGNGAGIKIDGARPFEIVNTLVYGNLAATSGTPVASGISAAAIVTLTLKNSLSDVTIPAPDSGDFITGSNISANLTSSNLFYDAASGFVKYTLPASGDATPIDFGTDGNDAGAWDSGLTTTLNVDTPAFNKNNVRVYKNNGTLYVNSVNVAISNIKVFDIQGRLITEQKNVKATSAVINNLKTVHQVLIVKIASEDNKEVTKKVVN